MKEYSNDGGNTWEGPFSENEIECLTSAGVISAQTVFREYGAQRHAVQKVERVGTPVAAPQVQGWQNGGIASPQPMVTGAYAPVSAALPSMPQAMTALPTVPPAMVPQPVTRQFYIARADGTQVGPVPESTLLASYCSGIYPPSTLVYTESQGCWLPISQVLGGAAMEAPAMGGTAMRRARASVPMRQVPRNTDPISAYFRAFSLLTFEGRVRRSEYWMASLGFTLFSLLLFLFLMGIVYVSEENINLATYIAYIWLIVNAVVAISLTNQRLHDIGMSGWWQLLYFTGIGHLFLFVLCCLDSEKCTNKYGPSPKYLN